MNACRGLLAKEHAISPMFQSFETLISVAGDRSLE